MAGDHEKKMELVLKKNRGHRIVATWSRRLSDACEVEISTASFLSIEKTEELKRAFFTKVKNEEETFKTYWKKQDRDGLIAQLLDKCIDVRFLPVILFSSVDQFVGAVRVPADCILRNAMSVWIVTGEDLSMATEDLQHGLCLEENYYTPTGEYVPEGAYELTTWGMFGGGKSKVAGIETTSQ